VALHHPVLFLIALAIFVAGMVWLLPRIWRGIKAVVAWVRRKLGGGEPEPGSPPVEQIL
jgi:hypothetical protein